VAVLPGLGVEARGRLLAVLVAERGRTLARARTPLAAAEVLPVVETSPVEAQVPASALPRALAWAIDDGERARGWRLGLAGVVATPLWAGPWRFGPSVGLSNGPVTVAAVATFGVVTVPLEGVLSPRDGVTPASATILAQSFSLQPELGLVGLRGAGWVARLLARGHLGYGALTATGVGTTRGGTVASIEAGGAAVIAVARRLSSSLALQLDASVGWVWAVSGTAGGVVVAALGGGLVSVSLAVLFGWSGA
jgi:hypothetical protein